MEKRERKKKAETRGEVCSFRTGSHIVDEATKIGIECSRTLGLQIDYFVRQGIKRYRAKNPDKETNDD